MKILKNRNFSILFSGQLVSTFGNSLFFIALPWYVYTLTQSKAALALTGLVQTLPAVAGLFTGVFVDRWSKRWTMIGSDVIRIALSLALFWAVVGKWHFVIVLSLVLLLQFVGTFFNPASGAFTPLIVSLEEIPAAVGLSQSGSAVAQLLGTAFGGGFMAAFGAPLLFLFDALSFFVSVVSLFFIRAKEPSRNNSSARQGTSFFKEWVEGFQIFSQYKFFLLIVASALVANFAMAPVDVSLTAWVKGPMHGNPIDLGAVNAAFFLGIIAGGIGLGFITKRLPMRQILMYGMTGSGLLMMAIGFFANVYWDAIIILITGFLIGSVNGALSAMAMQVIPEALRGRVFATIGALATLAMPLGMALFGTLMIHVPLSVLFVIMGVFSVLSGLTYLLPVKDDTVASTSAISQTGHDSGKPEFIGSTTSAIAISDDVP